jgi:transposase
MVNMRAYSQDLRDRAIDLHKTFKYKIKAISTLLSIERHTISSWIRRYQRDGDYSSKQHLQNGRKAKFTDKEKIVEFLTANPDSQGIDIRDALVPGLAMSTFYDTLRRMRITYKKKSQSTKVGMKRPGNNLQST